MSGTDYNYVVLKIHSCFIYYLTLQSYRKVVRVVSSSCFCFRKIGEGDGRIEKNAVISGYEHTVCSKNKVVLVDLVVYSLLKSKNFASICSRMLSFCYFENYRNFEETRVC